MLFRRQWLESDRFGRRYLDELGIIVWELQNAFNEFVTRDFIETFADLIDLISSP